MRDHQAEADHEHPAGQHAAADRQLRPDAADQRRDAHEHEQQHILIIPFVLFMV